MKSALTLIAVCVSITALFQPAFAIETRSAQLPQANSANNLSLQVARLEQTVAQLQQQIALLQSIIKVSGSTVEIAANRDLKIKAGGALEINAGMNTAIRSAMNTTVQSGMSTYLTSSVSTDVNSGAFFKLQSGRCEVNASSEMALKGAILRLNRGSKQIATVGSLTAGNQVATGSPTIFGE